MRTTTAANAEAWQQTGLACNTPYAMQVAAATPRGDSERTATVTCYTLAATPLAPALSYPSATTLAVGITAGDGNPTATLYAIRVDPDVGGNPWLQADGSLGAAAVYAAASTWGTRTITGLADQVLYSFTAIARNGDGLDTAASPAASAATPTSRYHVDAGRSDDSGDGLTWATAKKTVQAAIGATSVAHQVWVKAGTYGEARPAADGSLVLANGVELYGGFAGDETELGARAVAANPTILSGATSRSGSPAYHVVTMTAVSNTRLDGFTVTGGAATSSTIPNGYGGGIYGASLDATNTIANCTVTANTATYGGGLYCASASPAVSDCTIAANTASYGGGVCLNNGTPTLTSCTIAGNAATSGGGGGGGGYCFFGASALTDCLIAGNTAAGYGGGLLLTGGSPTVTDCTVANNTSGATGGGLACAGPTATVTRCRISGNTAGTSGGGLYSGYTGGFSPSVALVNCTVSGNTATTVGGGLHCTLGTVSLTNATVSGNRAGSSGGGLHLAGAAGTLVNCVLSDAQGEALYEGYSGSDPTVTNCLFYGNTGGAYYDHDTASTFTVAQFGSIVPADKVAGCLAGDPCFVMDSSIGVRGTWSGVAVYSSGTHQTTLTAPAGTFTAGALVGRLLNPDRTDGTYQRREALVVSNTDAEVVVWGDHSYAGTGDAYRLVDDHLWSGSTAIDQGTASGAPATDIEGNPRPVDIPDLTGASTYDIGAYEAQSVPPLTSPRPIYVDRGRADDSGDGFTWATAKKTVQAAIDVCVGPYRQVWVKAGTYDEARLAADGSLVLRSSIELYGGFAGDETELGARAVAANPTVLSGATARGGNPAYHVVSLVGITAARLDGFTVTGGVANGTSANSVGGGLYCSTLDSTSTIANCVVSGNTGSYGGGLYLTSSSPALTDCTVSGNTATSYGGGLYLTSSSPALTDCTVSGNTATYGGGLCAYANVPSTPTLTNCTVSGNTASYDGGLYFLASTSPTLTNCMVNGNRAATNVGGLGLAGAAASVTNCTLSGNQAGGDVGGLYVSAPNAALTNCMVSGNHAGGYGGGVCLATSTATVTNCTLSGNQAGTSGGGVYCTASPTLRNCILSDSSGPAVYEANSSADPILTNCLFYGNAAGDYYDYGSPTVLTGADAINALLGNSGCVEGDPRFAMDSGIGVRGTWAGAAVYSSGTNQTTLAAPAGTFTAGALVGRLLNPDRTDGTYQRRQAAVVSNTDAEVVVWGDHSYAGAGDAYRLIDYHLWSTSAAIDRGTSTGAPATDLEGNPRPVDIPDLAGTSPYDIGAYEAQAVPPVAPDSPGATAVGTDTITWTWTDRSGNETGFAVYVGAGTTAGETASAVTAADVTSWLHTGLSPNTQWACQVAAVNGTGESPKTSTLTAWTLAATPVAPVVGNPGPTTLEVSLCSGDGNPAGTPYALCCASTSQWVQADGSLGAAPVWQSADTWGTTAVLGLQSGDTFTFQAKARNEAGVETSLGPGASGTPTPTLSATPAAPDLLPASDTGSSASDDLTRLDNSTAETRLQFEVSGTVTGATVRVYADAVEIGNALAAGTTTTVTTDGATGLADGIHSITARQTAPLLLASAASDALAVTVDVAPPDLATSSSADRSFGSDGAVLLDAAGDGRDDWARDVVVQSGGKLVTAGRAETAAGGVFCVSRFLAGGTPDPTFGDSGTVLTAVGPTDAEAFAVAGLADGRIVAVGRARNLAGNDDVALVRYTADGALDDTFGSAGIATTDLSGNADVAYAVVVQWWDNRVVAVGARHNGSDHDMAATRYNPDGSVDTSYGVAGTRTVALAGGADDVAFGAAIQTDGKVVLAGHTAVEGRQVLALARLDLAGALDTSFGAGGTAIAAAGTGDAAAAAVVVQPDGRLLVAGTALNETSLDLVAARWSASGAADTSFGTDGIALLDVSGTDDAALDLVVQPDGRMVLAGSTVSAGRNVMLLSGLAATGGLDASFGHVLPAVGDAGGGAEAYAVALAPGGKVVAAGKAYNGSDYDAALVQLQGVSWEVRRTHGAGVGEVWTAVSNGYVESRTAGLTCVAVRLAEAVDPVSVGAGTLTITDHLDNTFPVTGATVAEDDRTVVFTFPALPDGRRYTFAIAPTLTDLAGCSLGVTLSLGLGALAGDANGDGAVDIEDLAAVRARASVRVAPAHVRYDINADGRINAADLLAIRSRIGGALP